MAGTIRLILLTILLLISLLAVCKAPEYHLWLLAVAVTEFPWVFAGITLLLLATGFWISKYNLTSTVIGIIALILFLSPIARAYIIAQTLNKNLDAALNINDQINVDTSSAHLHTRTSAHPLPFSFLKMFAGNVKVPYRTTTYATYADTSMSLDFYPNQSDDSMPRPCVIVIHGGSWSGGDSKQVPELNSYLAVKGYNVAAINYRMAPEWQNPAPVEDVANAIKYLKSHAAGLHIDTNKIVLLGRSAGAQIALLAAYTLHNAGIKGVIDFYGPADMVWGYSVPANPWVLDSKKVMENYLGGTYAQVPQNYAASSPVEFVNRQTPPTLIIHGANDVLVAYEHSRRLNEKLQQNGIKHYWLQLPWATHGFDFNLNGPGGQLSTFAVEKFINAITR